MPFLYGPALADTVNFTIDAGAPVSAIQPYAYGSNFTLSGVNNPLYRQGGNRLTAYDWINNYSNAGSDYYYQNDTYLGSPSMGPAGTVTTFVGQNKAVTADSLVTLQLAGYVAADASGPVSSSQYAPSSRFFPVQFVKGAPFVLSPNVPPDGTVYLDEFVNYLISEVGNSYSGGVKFYDLDNQPALWSSTHPEVHSAQATYAEVAGKGVSVATMVTAMDPGAQILGPVAYGWSEYVNNQSAPDAGTYTSYNTSDGIGYLNYYLAQMQQASNAAGRRLLHYLDVHWYPEAQGSNGTSMVRIAGSSDSSVGVAMPYAGSSQPLGLNLFRKQLDR